jgi:hypothetical protein
VWRRLSGAPNVGSRLNRRMGLCVTMGPSLVDILGNRSEPEALFRAADMSGCCWWTC